MVNDEERCFLALSILEGEREAHRILADLLEEEGDAGLASWARSRKGTNFRKRFEISLGVLPARLNVSLAADFVSHTLAWLARMYPDQDTWSGDVQMIASWARGEASVDSLKPACSRLPEILFGEIIERGLIDGVWPTSQQWHLGQAMTALAQAAHSALQNQESREPRLIRHFRNETGHLTRNTAKACREELCHHIYPRDVDEHLAFHSFGAYGTVGLYRYHKHSNVPGRNELNWQIDHVSETLRVAIGETGP